MRILFLVFVIIFYSLPALAQEKTVDKKFIVVNGFMVGATIFDVETTFRGLENCSNCKEFNPFMRPFINSGRPATYAVEMSVDTIISWYSYKLKKGNNKLWWVMPIVAGAAHSIAGSSNLVLSKKFIF